MTSAFLAPHNDDETLFGAFQILEHDPDVYVILKGFVQGLRGRPITWEQRTRETDEALSILSFNHPPIQWNYTDAAPDWERIEADIENLEAIYDRAIVPAVEEDGHEQHNRIGEIALRHFGEDRLTRYLTYTKNGRSTRGTEVVPQWEWIGLKHRALACYRSQIEETSTRPHFLDAIREYVA